jgi:hypothetical protein
MLLVNVAASIMLQIGGQVWYGSGVVTTVDQNQLNSLKGNVTGYPVDQTQSSIFIRIFDYITMGYLNKLVSFIDNGLHGFVNLLVTTGFVPADMDWFAQLLFTVFDVMYILYVIELWTGRNILGD